MIRRKTILETAILALLLVVLWASPAPAAGPGLVRDIVVSLLRELGLIDATNVPIPPPHNELSATHTDTVAAPPVRGDLIVANATPKWARFPTGISGTILSGGTDPSWTANPKVTSLLATNNLAAVGSNSINAVGDGAEPSFLATAYGVAGATNAPGFRGFAARGSLAVPAATQTGDLLAFFSGRGYGATGFAQSSAGRNGIYASEMWSDSAQGAEIQVETTANGTTTRTVRGIWTNDGRWVLGATKAATVPGLKPVGTTLAVRLGDDSADAPLSASTLTLSSGLVLTGTTVTGAPTWSSNQAITLSTAAQPNVTSLGTLTGLALTSGATLSWNSDTVLVRDAANDLALRNGATAQKLSVYNTYTSATNFESFDLDWSGTANVFNLHSSYGTAGGSPRQWVLGGYSLPTDAATMSHLEQGQSAYPQATVNTSGGNLLAYGGIGRRFWTFVTFGNVQTNSNTFTTTVNYTSVVLTASVDFQSITSNAVAATNLAAAINGNGTLSAQVTATAVGSSVYLTKKVTCYAIQVATNAAGGDATSTSGSDGLHQIGTTLLGTNSSTTAASPVVNNDYLLELNGGNSGTSTNNKEVALVCFGGSPAFEGWAAAGTKALPTASQRDSNGFSFRYRGYGATGWTTQGGNACIQLSPAENWTDTAQGVYIRFQPVAIGAVSNSTIARIDAENGYVAGNAKFYGWNSGASVTGTITFDTAWARGGAGLIAATLGTGTTGTGEVTAALYRSAVHASSTGTTTIDATATFWPCDSTTAAFTITLPTAASVSGRVYVIKKTDASANAVTVGTTSAQTIDGSTTYSLTIRYQTVSVISDGSNWSIYP